MWISVPLSPRFLVTCTLMQEREQVWKADDQGDKRKWTTDDIQLLGGPFSMECRVIRMENCVNRERGNAAWWILEFIAS